MPKYNVKISSNKQPNSKKGAAIRRAKEGRPVFPLHSIQNGKCSCGDIDCKSPGKHPMTAHGYKDASVSIKQINDWWDDFPEANIGIATGKKSNILVLDKDPRNGGDETMKALEKELGKLPKTVTVNSGGDGAHYYYAYPSHEGKLYASQWKGVDVLGDGKYVVAPASVHISGKPYQFKKDHSFKSIPLAELPEKWVNRLLNPANMKSKDYVSSGQNEATQKLASIVGSLHNKSVAPTDILNMLKVLEGEDSDGQLQSLVSSITSNPVRDNNVQVADAAYTVASKLLDKSYQGGENLIYAMDSKFYVFNGKIWVYLTKDVLSKYLFAEAEILSSTDSKIIRKGYDNVVKQALSILQSKQADSEDVFNFTKTPPAVINCKNGELWIDANGKAKLKPHNKYSYLTHILPIDYNDAAECPRFEQALKEIFRDTKKPVAMKNFFAEIMGYVIQPKRNIPLVIILLGGGQNGKTTLMSILYKILGENLVYFCNDIQELHKGKFALSELFGKRLIVDDDVKNGTKLPDGILKKISEEKQITVDQKYKSAFTFVCRAVPVLMCNNIPTISDLSHGMRRRLMVIPFNRKFTPQETDPELANYIINNELPGVLNFALKGLERLIANGYKLTRPKPIRLAEKLLLAEANPLVSFIDEKCKAQGKGSLPLNSIYESYSNWASENGITMNLQRNTLKRHLEHLGYVTKRRNNGNVVCGLVFRR